MKSSKLIEQVQGVVAQNNQTMKELIEENRIWSLDHHEEDPIVYLSIGPTCIPFTAIVENVSTVMGSINGICLNAKIDDLPPELNQRWFDLQQDIAKFQRGEYVSTPPHDQIELQEMQELLLSAEAIDASGANTIGVSFDNNVHPDHQGVHVGLRFYNANGNAIDVDDYDLNEKMQRVLWDKIKTYGVCAADVYSCFTGETLLFLNDKGISFVDTTKCNSAWENCEGSIEMEPDHKFHVGYSTDH